MSALKTKRGYSQRKR